MKHPHHTLVTWALAWACGLGMPSAWAQPSATTLDTLKQTETRMNALKALDDQARRAAQQASMLGNASWYADNTWKQARQSDIDASAALQRASDCLPRLQLELTASTAAISALEQSISTSHRAVQTVSTTPARQLAQRTRATDAAFEQRSSAEHSLAEKKRRLDATATECRSLVPAADAAVNRTVERLRQFEQHAHGLPAALQRLHTDMAAALSASQTAADAAWLSYRATTVALPSGTNLQQLEQALAGEPAPTRSEAADISTLLALTKADADFERITTELARLQDAAAFIDLVAQPAALTCRGDDCPSYTAERRDLTVRISAASTELGSARARLDAAVQASNQLLASVQAKARSNALSIERMAAAVAPAIDEASRASTLAQTAAEALEQASHRAYFDARTAWASAYQAAHGTEPVDMDEPAEAGTTRSPSPAPAMAAAPAPMAARTAPELRSHAYDVFAQWDAEPSGFGSYTYVLLRSRDDLKSPAVQRRFKVLLSTLNREQQARTVPTEQRPQVNVFCIPGTRAAGSSADELDVSYDSDLGNQLKLRTKDAVFTLKAARNRLTTSPGPFLITLPGRIAQGKGDAPLLFADLSTYPDDAIADLVASYMNGLLDNFPTDKTLWKPPLPQRVALLMIHLASNVGELVMDTIPAAQAKVQPR
jgi:predicted  nucleic acid-binding Zn-ribbon protein